MSGADSLTVEQPLIQEVDGGAIPTSALHKNLNGWKVERCLIKHIKNIILKNHYNKSICGCTPQFCYRLTTPEGKTAGGLFYGQMAMANQWKRFASKKENVIELRRLACINETPKNAESFFISHSLRLLKKHWNKNGVVVSYADKEYGHEGIIYKASNFKNLGFVKGAKVIIWNGKKYHDKSLRSKYKGLLKPFSKKLNEALKTKDAIIKTTAGKVCYIREL